MTFQAVAQATVVSRAISQNGNGLYTLGAGAPYLAPSPFSPDSNPYPGHCDCSGFVAWCLTYDRGPWNTDAMVADATGPQKRWTVVPAGEAPRPSDVIVKPGPDEDHDGHRDHPGHTGVIVGVEAGFVRGGPQWWEHLSVAHCMPRGKFPGAIRTSDAALWWHSGYLIRGLHVH